MSTRTRGLWQHRAFLRFWLGETISLFGSQITELALPLTAAVTLGATTAQMGVLTSLGSMPYVLSLFAGVWVDRLPRRPILMVADLGRGLLLASIPLAAWMGSLRIEHLYAVTFLTGLLTLVFGVARHAFLPALLPRDRLADGNSKLSASESLAQIAGPALAGTLVQWLTAPVAIATDAASFVVSALFLSRVRIEERAPAPGKTRPNVWREIWEGLEIVVRRPVLRATAASSLTLNFFGGIHDALFVLYITRQLGLPPIYFGLYYAVGSVAGLLAALLSGRLARRIGIGPAIVLGAFLIGIGWIAFPLSARWPAFAVPIFAARGLVGGFGNTIYNVSIATLSQATVPAPLLGRYNATSSFFGLGLLPLGALMGGALGARWGLYPTLWLGMIGSLTAFLWVLFSPLRGLGDLSIIETTDAGGGTAP